MDESLPWTISFYEKDNGACPIQEEFLSNLPDDDQRLIGVAMKRLCRLNVLAQPPFVRHLNGKLWELRVRACTKSYRLFYVCKDRQFVFLHGFLKKSRKTPPDQLRIAQRRCQEILTRL